jgi:hypothetical protein
LATPTNDGVQGAEGRRLDEICATRDQLMDALPDPIFPARRPGDFGELGQQVRDGCRLIPS